MAATSTALAQAYPDLVFIDATQAEEAYTTAPKKQRNLVVCIDGTANQFGPKVSYDGV